MLDATSRLAPLSVVVLPLLFLFVMGYTTNSGPFWVGSLVFLILGVVACFGASVLAKAGRNQYLGYTNTHTHAHAIEQRTTRRI